MKKLYLAISALILCLFVLWFMRTRFATSHWYGSCEIAAGYPSVAFISVNGDVYYDQNADRVPQPDELVPTDNTVTIRSLDGKSTATLQGISTALDPRAVSESCPQLIDLKIQSTEFAAIWQLGTIVMSRDPEKAGSCHLMGPLSFVPQFSDIKLKPGDKTEFKISIGTLQSDPAAVSPYAMSGALVYTSVDGDRDRSTYAFDETLRPKMEILFDSSESEPEIVYFDGFC